MGLLSTRPEPTPPEKPDPPLYVPDHPGVHHEAARVLREHMISFTEVLYVLPDAIWYRDATGVRTAWMRWTGAQLLVISEAGTPAEPSPSVLRRFDASST